MPYFNLTDLFQLPNYLQIPTVSDNKTPDSVKIMRGTHPLFILPIDFNPPWLRTSRNF